MGFMFSQGRWMSNICHSLSICPRIFSHNRAWHTTAHVQQRELGACRDWMFQDLASLCQFRPLPLGPG